MRFLAPIFLLVVNPIFAGEFALLASGSRLHVDRHETQGTKVRLYNGDGFIEMDAVLVVGFEAEMRVTTIPPVPEENSVPIPSPRQLADSAADKYGLPRT